MMIHCRLRSLLLFCLVSGGLLTLAGCLVGPNYKRPSAPVPPAFKTESPIPPPNPPDGGWKPAIAGNGPVPSHWWELYQDPQLNGLEDKVATSNQTLKAAYQAYQRSRQQIKVDRSTLFPTVGIGSSGSRNKASANRPFAISSAKDTYSDVDLEGQVSWEPDLWGNIRRTVESSTALAQASNADLATATLSLQAELAVDYFQLRGLDAQRELLDTTVSDYRRYVELTTLRFHAGLSSDADLALAQTQLDQTVAQVTDIGVARAQYEDALATLTGQPASSFHLDAEPLRLVLPPVPLGLPSELLERRPDIASAERRIDSANAQIGVAQAAFYPTLNLNGSGGYNSINIGSWIDGPSSLWSLGASATELLFDAGRRRAVKAEAIASYEQTTANYRQTVLQAFQEVQDNLAASRILDQEATQQEKAVADARRSLGISTGLYKSGLANYLQVITVQATLLANQRTSVDIAARQQTASVQLFKALGRGLECGPNAETLRNPGIKTFRWFMRPFTRSIASKSAGRCPSCMGFGNSWTASWPNFQENLPRTVHDKFE